MAKTITEIVIHNRISLAEALNGHHAIRAKDARERAIVFLRLLSGESRWNDGAERRVDDCFEMNDGDDVVRWLLRFANEEPYICNLLTEHSSVGPRCLSE
jgi:hypothetical protein